MVYIPNILSLKRLPHIHLAFSTSTLLGSMTHFASRHSKYCIVRVTCIETETIRTAMPLIQGQYYVLRGDTNSAA